MRRLGNELGVEAMALYRYVPGKEDLLDVLDDRQGDNAAVRDYPQVHRLRGRLSEDHAATEFEESLEALLDRMTLPRNEHLDS